MKKVILIGGHGKVALLLAPLLKADGWEVAAVIRNPAHIDDVAATGAVPVLHDVVTASPAELAELFTGADAIIFAAGAGGGSPERTYAVDRDAAVACIDAAEAAGVQRFIMVSYLGARLDHGVPPENSFFAYAEAKAAADAHLRASSLAWTIVGPGALTLDAPTGRINPAPAKDRAEGEPSNTSRANTALVIAAALNDPETAMRTIEFSDGPVPIGEALTP